jgi:hypothetical protein
VSAAAHEWAERHQAEPELPEPAPIRLSIAERVLHREGRLVLSEHDWCIAATHGASDGPCTHSRVFAHGSAPTLAAALQAAQEAAQRLHLTEVADGWTDGVTSKGFVPERAP